MSMALVFGAAACGVWLVVSGVRPTAPALDWLIEGPERRRGPGEATSADIFERLGAWARRFRFSAWFASPTLERDLAVTRRTRESHLGVKVGLALGGAIAPAPTLAVLASLGLHLPAVLPVGVALVLGAAGFLVPDVVLVGEAEAERVKLRASTAALAQLTYYRLRCGSGVSSALDGAAGHLTGWFGEEVSTALAQAEFGRESPWTALEELGSRLGLDDLREVAASVRQASTEGAAVAMSLEAKADALRTRAISEKRAREAPLTMKILSRVIGLAFCAIGLLCAPLLASIHP